MLKIFLAYIYNNQKDNNQRNTLSKHDKLKLRKQEKDDKKKSKQERKKKDKISDNNRNNDKSDIIDYEENKNTNYKTYNKAKIITDINERDINEILNDSRNEEIVDTRITNKRKLDIDDDIYTKDEFNSDVLDLIFNEKLRLEEDGSNNKNDNQRRNNNKNKKKGRRYK